MISASGSGSASDAMAWPGGLEAVELQHREGDRLSVPAVTLVNGQGTNSK